MKEAMDDVKSFLKPLTPPNNDIAEAVKIICKKNNIKLATSLPRVKNVRHGS
jgi:ribosome maturation protein Sdo1